MMTYKAGDLVIRKRDGKLLRVLKVHPLHGKKCYETDDGELFSWPFYSKEELAPPNQFFRRLYLVPK